MKKIFVLFLAALLLMSSIASAGFWDLFTGRVTGGGPTIAGTACTTNADCPSGQTCKDCPSGATCASAKLCMAAPGTTPEAVPDELFPAETSKTIVICGDYGLVETGTSGRGKRERRASHDVTVTLPNRDSYSFLVAPDKLGGIPQTISASEKVVLMRVNKKAGTTPSYAFENNPLVLRDQESSVQRMEIVGPPGQEIKIRLNNIEQDEYLSGGGIDLVTLRRGSCAELSVGVLDRQATSIEAKTPDLVAQQPAKKKPGLISRLFGKKEVSTLPAAGTEETAPSGGKKPAGEGKAPSGATEPAGKGVSECVQACNAQQKKCLAAKKPAKTCAKEMQECKAKCQPSETTKPAPPSPPAATEGFQKASWECYDGTKEAQGGETSCKPVDVWLGYAKEACKGKCNNAAATNTTATNTTLTYKCGLNSFSVYYECKTGGCKVNADCAAGYACSPSGECVAY